MPRDHGPSIVFGGVRSKQATEDKISADQVKAVTVQAGIEPGLLKSQATKEPGSCKVSVIQMVPGGPSGLTGPSDSALTRRRHSTSFLTRSAQVYQH